MPWRAALTGTLTVAAIVTIGVAVVNNSPQMSDTASTAAPATTTPSAAPATCTPVSYPNDGPLPVSVRIQKLGVSSNLIPLCLNADQTVQVPPTSTPQVVGWYALHPRPGDVGPAVLLAHTDGDRQLGAFHNLKNLRAGDKVSIGRADGSPAVFSITKVETYTKDQFPTQSIYGPTLGPELRMISCTGPFSAATGQYQDNIVAFAKLTK